MEIKNNASGNLVISEEVVGKIASSAAMEVEGVAGVVSKNVDIRSFLRTKRVAKPVHIFLNDNQFVISIFVKIKEGYKIADIALKIQQAVKEAVQNMTGSVVTKVNVNICEIELSAAAKE